MLLPVLSAIRSDVPLRIASAGSRFGGDVAKVMREKTQREQAFIREQDKKHDSTWDWLRLKRDELRQVLGFFIGEPPVDPFAAALATGPP